MCSAMKAAARSSSEPPISPISMTASVSGRLRRLEAVDEVRPRDRVATDAHAGGLTDPLLGQLVEGLVVKVPERETMPTGPPARAMSPEVMPMFVFPGEMMPGQFGPSSRVPGNSVRSRLNVRASSWAGIPR